MGEAGPEAILPLRRGADGKLGVVAAGSGGMAMFAPEYNIEIHNDAGNGQIGPQALQAVYNIGKKPPLISGNSSRVTGYCWRRAITMETFNWKIRPDMTVESEPKVTSIKLGDGYEQRRPAGLNNHLAKYNVTVRIRKGEHQNLEAFLSRHGGVKSFLWTPPYTWTQIRVICRKWSINVGSLWVTVTTTFEQVVI